MTTNLPAESSALTGLARIDRKIRVVDQGTHESCWEWLGAITDRGYGRVHHNGRPRKAHRVTYELLRGPIPDGLVIDHLCRNRLCVNPRHLDAVSIAENNRRGARSTASGLLIPLDKCVNGHDYTPENTVWRGGARKGCKECARARSASHYREKRADQPKAPCRVCGKALHHMSVARHERNVHGLAA